MYGKRGKRTLTLLIRNCKCVRKGDEKVTYVPDLALQGKRKQVKVTDPDLDTEGDGRIGSTLKQPLRQRARRRIDLKTK